MINSKLLDYYLNDDIAPMPPNDIIEELFHDWHNDKIKKLIMKHGFSKLKDFEGNNSLHLACFYDNHVLIKDLLNSDIDIYSKNDHGYMPFNCYTPNDDDITQLFLNLGININIPDPFGNTILHVACEKNLIKNIDFLLSNNANINIQNNHGNTPLHHACINSNFALIQLLLTYNYNTDKLNTTIKNVNNETAFDIAIIYKNVDIIKMLNSYQNHYELNNSLNELPQSLQKKNKI